MWYAVRLSWIDPNSGERTYISGGSLVGGPAFTYGKTPYFAFGCTSLNPDVMDVYTETIENGKYLYDGAWHDVDRWTEKFKIRGLLSSSVTEIEY